MTRAVAALALALPLAARAATTVELSQGAEALSGDRPAWRVSALDAVWTGEPGAAVGGSVRELSRFGLEDVDGAIWAQAPLGGFVLGVEGSASPTWRFVPRWSLGARLERGLGDGWVASLASSARRYEGDVGRTTVTISSLGLERYWDRWRAAAYATAAGVEGAWGGSGRAVLDLYYGASGRVGVSVAAGRELESLGGGQVLRTDVLAVALAGAHPFGAGWAMTWEVSAQRQGDLYSRAGGRLGLRRRF
ncbi:YaiO family outer membrane beta-barrel protein [Anaeromyxobacter oryzisoli]|uniref:YaiO family outer membrane beta-barrel protein n=1 Tax=Anaeromyxobacter oryzisoli TaxID=2925408 RepID=UPI001F5AFFC4|nr:YaiO family outer membrane beta-barrel protein [Anaeromyxobacter sp. SG63]